MRNEALDALGPPPSSGSDSSPSWASPATPATEFTFDFANKTIDELTARFKSTLRSRSSEILHSENSEDKSTPSSSGVQFLFPGPTTPSGLTSGSHLVGGRKSPKKCKKFGSVEIHSTSVDAENKKRSESKIARFLRRTQSEATSQPDTPPACHPKCGGECSREGLSRIDDAEEPGKPRRRPKLGTDMKFRLGFLKRRHTEGTINSASVRPPPEEALKWANSFNDLIASKYGLSLFRAFLQREFSEENIEFWVAIEDYRKSRSSKLNTKAQKIYNDYIIAQAPKEVNLDSLTREGLVSKMSQPPNANTFDQAQKRIQGLLEADAYLRFLKSDLYLELCYPEKYSQNSS